MRILLAAVVAAAVMPAFTSAGSEAAGQRVPAYRIVDSVRIDGRREDLSRTPKLALRSDGSVAVTGAGARLFLFDSTGRKRWVRNLRQDLWSIDALRWVGDSIIVVDNGRDFVMAVSANGGVGDLFEFPDLIRPKFSERRSLKMFRAFDVIATTPDGQLVGTPRGAANTGVYGKGEFDPKNLPVLRVDQDGIVQRQLAVVVNDPKGDQWFVLSDARLVILRPAADSVAFIAISPQGDTLFSRFIPKARFFTAATTGPDGTIWLGLGDGGPVITHMAFDQRGATLGRIGLPNSIRIGAGDARQIWVYDPTPQKRMIARYVLTR